MIRMDSTAAGIEAENRELSFTFPSVLTSIYKRKAVGQFTLGDDRSCCCYLKFENKVYSVKNVTILRSLFNETSI